MRGLTVAAFLASVAAVAAAAQSPAPAPSPRPSSPAVPAASPSPAASPAPAPARTPAQLRRGAELLAKAVEAFGGAAAVDGVTALEVKSKGTRRVQGGDMEVTTTTRYFLPDLYHQELVLPMGTMKTVLGRDSAFIVAGEGALPLPDAERDALRKLMRRGLIPLLQARGKAGVQAAAVGQGTIDGTSVEIVEVRQEGGTVLLAIDPASGRILQSTFDNPAGGIGAPGTFTVVYSDYRKVGALSYPFAAVGTMNGQPAFNQKVESVVVNAKLDEALFVAPAPHTMFPGENDVKATPAPSPAPTPSATPAPAPTPSPKE